MEPPEPDPLHPEGYCIQCDHDDEDYRDKHFWSLYDYEHECLCMCHVYNDDIKEQEILDMIHLRISKFCDKCNLSYPEYTIMCIRCHGTNLRPFKIYNNMEELQKNWKDGQTSIYQNFKKR